MLSRWVAALTVAGTAACGSPAGSPDVAEPELEARDDVGRFEVSVDTQRIADPDAYVPPSENPDN